MRVEGMDSEDWTAVDVGKARLPCIRDSFLIVSVPEPLHM